MVRARNAVSGPGRLSRRTDMAPQNQGQPTRVASGQPYGERQAMQAQQNAAPMQSDDPGTPPAGLTGGAFGPTQRPGEPITAGVEGGPGVGPARRGPTLVDQDPDLFLRAMYQRFPHPDIKRLLLRRRRSVQ